MDAEHIREIFSGFRPVEVRNMFGGIGILADGSMFAIAFNGVIFLKTDEDTVPAFEREGAKPFVYPLAKTPRVRKKPSTFWRLPERLYDDPDELAVWAQRSLAIAQRKQPKKMAGKRKAAANTASRKPASRKKSAKKVIRNAAARLRPRKLAAKKRRPSKKAK